MSATDRPAPQGRPTSSTRSEAALREEILEAGGSLAPRRPDTAWRAWANRALQSRDEVDAAVAELESIGLGRHPDRPKNWDYLVALGSILAHTAPTDRVLEMGAAPYSPLLVWLYQYGYRRLRGIDLVAPGRIRRGPIKVEPMDLTATSFRSGAFGAIACLSVVEHGVDIVAYLAEARRLLRPGGVFVTSTDYWCDPIVTANLEAYGGPVQVFDRPAIEAFLASARRVGFSPVTPVDLDCRERVVHWDRTNLDYTFVNIVLEAPQRGLHERLRRRLRVGLPGDHR